MKEVRRERLHMCHYSICIVSRTGKFIERESRLVVVGGWRREGGMGRDFFYKIWGITFIIFILYTYNWQQG